jgi:hypothetical protein
MWQLYEKGENFSLLLISLEHHQNEADDTDGARLVDIAR